MGRVENKEQNNVLIPLRKINVSYWGISITVHITSKLSKVAQMSLGFCLKIKLLKQIK